MIIDKQNIKSLQSMVGKVAKYRTALGMSVPHIIENIELHHDDIIFVLRRKHSSLLRKRKAALVEIIEEKTTKPIDNKIKLEERKEQKEKKLEKQKLKEDRKQKLEAEIALWLQGNEPNV